MSTSTVQQLAQSLADAHGPCYRRIQVTVDSNDKKVPKGERNNLTQVQIDADPGRGSWLSIALKHCPNLYVVDFDTHELSGCSLHEYCTALDTARTQTTKGEHHYVYITDIPNDVEAMLTGSRQQKLCAQPQFEVDLLKGNNVWEPASRAVSGELRTISWSDVALYFNLSATETGPPPKRARRNNDTTAAAPPVQLPDGAADWLRDHGVPVVKTYRSRHNCVCAHVDRDCPFTQHSATSTNNRYVAVTPLGLVLRCHSQRCCGKQVVLDYQPPSTGPVFHGLPSSANEPSDSSSQDMDIGEDQQPPDDGDPSEPAVTSKEDQISQLLAWKLSHPSYGVQQLRVAAGDDLSVPLRFGELSMHSSSTKVEDDVAILTANVQMCPNVGAVFQPKDDRGRPIGPEVTCDGRMRIVLEKEFPHKFTMACPCCEKAGGLILGGVGSVGFHRDDTAVHELIWVDYNQCRGGLNHIAVFENDFKPAKIPHGTRCKMYITNALNDYALRMGYHKRGAVVQVRSETCPIAFETVRVGNEDMSFKLFIEEAERSLPRLKETMKTSDYKRWIEWCITANHSEFPVLKPDRHLLAFSNVAVDITGGDMKVKSFEDVSGAVARAYNSAEFKPEYVDMPFNELLALCPLFRKYIVTHFPVDLVERFDF
jgi:hypothetical protein